MTTRAAKPATFRADQGISAYGAARSTIKGAPLSGADRAAFGKSCDNLNLLLE